MRQFAICMLATGLLCAPVSAGEKSPKTAFFLSMLAPGLGELYAGARWRGAGFLAAETLTWVAFFSWRGKGNDLKAEFRAYADQHWHESRYLAWETYNRSQPQPYFETHHMPSKTHDTQQYYELIGKYNQFVFGWDDVTIPLTTDNANVLSPRRLDYENHRNESNKYLKRATQITGLAVVNRIASAIHAKAYTRARQSNTTSPIWIDIAPVDIHGRSTVELKARF